MLHVEVEVPDLPYLGSVGDEVLRRVARTMARHARTGDVAGWTALLVTLGLLLIPAPWSRPA